MTKKIMLWIAGLGVVGLLSGAAFLGARLIGRGGAPFSFPFGRVMAGPGGGSMEQVRIELERSPDLPQREPEESGMVQEKKDNSLIIAERSDPFSSENTGPPVEVVITADTRLYRDATLEGRVQPPAESMKLQQKLEPATVDEVKEDDLLQVWGEKRGDRIIAEFVVLMRAVIIQKGG